MLYVGIDVAKASLQVCVLGQTAEQRSFSNDLKGWKQLEKWLKRGKAVWVALEATGRYGDGVCEYLHKSGYQVSVVNPARIKAYAQSQLKRHKTDVIDAALLADFCRTQQPALWSPPSPAERELRALVRHWDDLKTLRQAELNRLEAKPDSAAVVSHIRQLIALLDTQIAQVERSLNDHLDQHPDLKAQYALLTSIPGIGKITSFHLLAELGDLRRFTDVRQVVALVGLHPQQRQSGRRTHFTAGITKMGRASLRRALYMPALVAKRCNPILKLFAQRLAANGLTRKQVIVAVMRKLLHLAYGVLKSNRPFDPNYAQTAVHLAPVA
jgi:transposase